MLVGSGVVFICVELYRIGLIVSKLRWFELKSNDTVKFKRNILRQTTKSYGLRITQRLITTIAYTTIRKGICLTLVSWPACIE